METLAAIVPENCFRSSSVEEMQAKMSREYREHRVSTTRICPPVKGLFYGLPLKGMDLNCLSYGAEVDIDIGDFEDFYMFEFPISGFVNLQLGNARYRSAGQCGSIVSPGYYVRSTWSEDCAQVMLKVEKAALRSYLQGLLLRDVADPVIFEPVLRFDRGPGAALYQQLIFILKQAQIDDGSMESRLYRKEISNSILAAILDKLPHNYSEAVRDEANKILPVHVLRAYRFILNNFPEQITNEDLARISGVSLRTLYAGFHRFMGMSPQSFLRILRLQKAREELEQTGAEVPVAEIATRCGFTHMGRFSADFRRRFGRTPSEVHKFVAR